MKEKDIFDVIIVGGSYSGLAAGMALGRALRKVLIVDSGLPCNRQAPHSHNFITQDGQTPTQITALAKQQVEKYGTVKFLKGTATEGRRALNGFEIRVDTGEILKTKKLIFATGIKDTMPDIDGFSDCWGVSALHCPYCHGYEVRNQATGVLGNGPSVYEFSMLISNWSKDLTLYTNGKSTLTPEQTQKLQEHDIKIVETEILKMKHQNGFLKNILLKNGQEVPMKVLYSKPPFTQHCAIPEKMGCELNDEGYIHTNLFQKTSQDGIYACGDNTTRMRTIANSVAMGTTAGMMLNKELTEETF